MKRRVIFTIILLVTCLSIVFSQTQIDTLNFSYLVKYSSGTYCDVYFTDNGQSDSAPLDEFEVIADKENSPLFMHVITNGKYDVDLSFFEFTSDKNTHDTVPYEVAVSDISGISYMPTNENNNSWSTEGELAYTLNLKVDGVTSSTSTEIREDKVYNIKFGIDENVLNYTPQTFTSNIRVDIKPSTL